MLHSIAKIILGQSLTSVTCKGRPNIIITESDEKFPTTSAPVTSNITSETDVCGNFPHTQGHGISL